MPVSRRRKKAGTRRAPGRPKAIVDATDVTNGFALVAAMLEAPDNLERARAWQRQIAATCGNDPVRIATKLESVSMATASLLAGWIRTDAEQRDLDAYELLEQLATECGVSLPDQSGSGGE